jgi:hypothetical protein
MEADMQRFTQEEKDKLVAFYAQRCENPPVVSHRSITWNDWGYCWTIALTDDRQFILMQDEDPEGQETPLFKTVEELLGFLILCEEIEGAKEVDAIMRLNAR